MNTRRIPERGGLCSEQYVTVTLIIIIISKLCYPMILLSNCIIDHYHYELSSLSLLLVIRLVCCAQCGFAHGRWFLHTHLLSWYVDSVIL